MYSETRNRNFKSQWSICTIHCLSWCVFSVPDLIRKAATLHKISSSIPFDIAVLIEPLSVAVNAVRETYGDSILNALWNKEQRDETVNKSLTVFVIFGDG